MTTVTNDLPDVASLTRPAIRARLRALARAHRGAGMPGLFVRAAG